MNEHASDWEAVAHTLGNSNKVCFNFSMLVCEKFSCSSVAGLNFIQNQKRTILITFLFQEREKRIVRQLNPANTLDGVVPSREHSKATQRDVIERLRRLGVIEPEG